MELKENKITIEDYLEEAQRLNYDEYEFREYLDRTCTRKIDMYYCGWECDTRLWVMRNGDKICTNHGTPYIVSIDEFESYRNNLENYVKLLKEL